MFAKMSKSLTAGLLSLTLIGSCNCPSSAQTFVGSSADKIPGQEKQDNRQKAILINVENYDHFPDLSQFTYNDVVALKQTLVERGGFSPNNIYEVNDRTQGAGFGGPLYSEPPTQANIKDKLERTIAFAEPEDNVFVYFSGHGCRDAEGRMYLAGSDCDPRDPAKTGVPVEWLREQLAKSPAAFKLLVIDACHAGSDKADDPTKGVNSNSLGENFRDLTGVVTLASSTGDEKSQLYPDKKQSLFTYWLAQGLKGHADENSDSQVDIDELNKYVHRNVSETADQQFGHKQNPKRIVRGDTFGAPVVVRLKPMGLRDVILAMAEQIDAAARLRKMKTVAVTEFTADTPLGEALGADFGNLGKLCASKLEDRLVQLGGSSYSVIDSRRLQKALSSMDFGVDDLGDPERMSELGKQLGGTPYLALGMLRERVGRQISLQCRLVEPAMGSVMGSAGGLALLTDSDWVSLGKSAALKKNKKKQVEPAPRPTEPNTEGQDVPPANSDVDPYDGPVMPPPATDDVDDLDEESDKPHPLSRTDFEFPVRLIINGQEREGVFHGNNYYVPVRGGEVYSVRLANKSGKKAILRLLVDGLNWLPQKLLDKGVDVMEVAPRVALSEARWSLMDPSVAPAFEIAGFVSATGTQGALREFKLVDAKESLAARKKFTEQVGIITAAFYEAIEPEPEPSFAGSLNRSLDGAAPGLGTTTGKERQVKLEHAKKHEVGRLLAAVNIRYVDAAELAEMQKQWAAE